MNDTGKKILAMIGKQNYNPANIRIYVYGVLYTLREIDYDTYADMVGYLWTHYLDKEEWIEYPFNQAPPGNGYFVL